MSVRTHLRKLIATHAPSSQDVLVASTTEIWESVLILTTSCFTAASSHFVDQGWQTSKFALVYHSSPVGSCYPEALAPIPGIMT